jgi:hypothetical protein
MIWIDVNDRLPTNSRERVLVSDYQEGYHVAYYKTEYTLWISICEHQLYDVTHWIRLPECKGELECMVL